MLSGLTRLVGTGAARSTETASSVLNSARTSNRRRVISEASSSDPYSTFVRDWQILSQDLTAPDQAALHHGISRTDIPERLERFTMAIVAESTTIDEALDGMGPCMELLLKQDVLSVLVSAAIANRPNGILIEAVKTFQVLIANLDARFLSQQAVNKSLVRLIRYCVGDEDVDSAWGQEEGFEFNDGEKERVRMGSEESATLEEALVGLMAFVASKLHNAQELLYIFFHDRQRDVGHGSSSTQPQRPDSPTDSVSSTATLRAVPATPTIKVQDIDTPGNTHEYPPPLPQPTHQASYDFPLFTYLLRFVHAEGQTGSLARAGLSVIVKIAFEARPSGLSRRPEDDAATLDLAEYILNSDFVVVIGASLGAVYGLLPSKLAILPPKQTDQNVSRGGTSSSRFVNGGMSLGASDDRTHTELLERLARLNIEPSTNPQIAERLLLFVDILDFVQADVLARAAQGTSAAVLGKKAIIAHHLIERLVESIRTSLMANILYPSMVESGDRDGSAVAVMSYLEVFLSVLDDAGPLAEETIGWLIRQEEDEEPMSATPTAAEHRSTSRGQRRKSAALLLLEQDKQARRDDPIFDPLLHYTIKNLISDHIAPTTSHGAVAAALGLARAFMARHGRFAPFGLINVVPDDTATCYPFHLPPLYAATGQGTPGSEEDDSFQYPGAATSNEPAPAHVTAIKPTVGLNQHLKEIDLYFSLVAALEDPGRLTRTQDALGNQEGFSSSTGYENYLRDAEEALLSDSSYLFGQAHGLTHPPANRLGHNIGTSPHDAELSYAPFRHRLDPADPLLRSVLSRLRRFFEQPPELNVSLASLIYSISLCPYLSLEDWLTFDRGDFASFAVEGDDAEESADWRKGPQRQPQEQKSTLPRKRPIIMELLRILVNHVQNYRKQVPDFDKFLAERRKGLLFVENLTDALGLQADIGDDDDGSAASSMEPSIAVPATFSSTKARQLWEGTGLSDREAKAAHVEGDIQVVDVRDVKLPPRPSEDVDVSSTQANDARKSSQQEKSEAASTSFLGFSRLFGRSTKAAAAGRKQGEVPSSERQHADKDAAVSAEQDVLPFADHYAQTAAISLEPTFVPMPKGPWRDSSSSSSARRSRRSTNTGVESTDTLKRTRFALASPDAVADADPTATSTSTDSDVSYTYPGQEDDEREEARRSRGRVTLSALLDNVVILEEFVKELCAVIQVRRSLGVDLVGLLVE